MAYRINKVSCYRGRYFRTIGQVLNDRGAMIPKKFLLGTDEVLARAASARLERLWDEVEALHQLAVKVVSMGARLGSMNRILPELKIPIADVKHGPRWLPESLAIAEAIRKGQHEIAVEVGTHDRAHEYVERIMQLRRDYSVIAFTPASPEVFVAGQDVLRGQAERKVQEVKEIAELAQSDAPTGIKGTLYQAIDAYAEHAQKRNQKEFGYREAAAARRLKDSHPDIALSRFGLSCMERIAHYWMGRPKGKRTGKPIALDTVTNALKVTRRFVQWLHRTDAFEWRKPADTDEALACNVARLRSDAEISALKDGVDVWTVDELTKLYQYATDQDRLFILLGLNCGFAQAEICTLRLDEIDRQGDTVEIKRIRRKTMVYGEFVLWPETVKGLDWFRTQRKRVKSDCKDYAIITQRGTLYDRQRISNGWNNLLDRVQADIPSFPRLSFKHLRKTAGQLIRNKSNGEIQGIFLCHGHPVSTDRLADDYSNRPFPKVAAVTDEVRGDLRIMFDAAPDAFSQQGARRTAKSNAGHSA